MPAPQPASEAVKLYNELLERPFSDRKIAEQYEWRLSAHKQRDPRAVDSRVALVEARQMAAKPIEAAQEARELHNLVPLMAPHVFRSYYQLTKDLGIWDLATQLTEDILNNYGKYEEYDLENIAFEISLGSGQIDFLTKMLELGLGENTIGSVFSVLESSGIAEHFKEQMKLVNDELEGKFVQFEIIRVPTWEPTEFGFTYHIDQDKYDLREIENRIDDLLIGFYSDLEFQDVAPYLPNFSFNVFPHEAASHRLSGTQRF